MPTVFNDANGEYLGFDRQVHQAADFQYFTDLSLWDTFRTVHPLYTLIAPKDQRDMVVSLVKMLEQGGWLPRWPSGHGYSNSMLGTPADIVIAESYLKGIRDFDVETGLPGHAPDRAGAHAAGRGFLRPGRRGALFEIPILPCRADGGVRVPNLRVRLGRSGDFAPGRSARSSRRCGAVPGAFPVLSESLEYQHPVFPAARCAGKVLRAVQAAAPDLPGSQRQVHEGLCRGQRAAMALGGALSMRRE